MTKFRIIVILCLLINIGNMKGQAPPQVVSSVDLQRYLGKWFEIASFPVSFQKNCYCVSAEYSLTEKGAIKVFNSCRKGSVKGKPSSIAGKAFVVKGSNNAKLKVQFFWPFRGDYWIIDLADDYSWAVVSGPTRKYLWILCRQTSMDESVYQAITGRLQKNGFDLGRLQKMVHE
jgi:apolipoprotein D and lipocalin family protein